MGCVCSAGMQQASINLSESLHEVYEPDWYGKDDVMVLGKVSPTIFWTLWQVWEQYGIAMVAMTEPDCMVLSNLNHDSVV